MLVSKNLPLIIYFNKSYLFLKQFFSIMKITKTIFVQPPKDKRVLTCNNCADDCYVENLKECLEFIQTKKSNRLLELYRNQTTQVYKSELKKIQEASRLYHIRLCCEGTSHLWRQQSKILMVRQAFQFVKEIHGSQHFSAQQMIEKARQYKIYLTPVLDFIKEFPSFCKFCTSSKKVTKLPYTQKSPIWSLLFNKFSLNFQEYDRNQTVDELLKKLQIAECLDDSCTKDQYDRQNQICLFIISKKCFPPLPKGEGSSPNRSRLKKKAKLMKIKLCQFNTEHLWMKQSQLKVPMQKQARQIAKLLHGQTAHRPKTQIKQIIFKNQTKIYTHGLITAIDQIVSQCTVCHPKSADPIQDRQSNNSEQQKTQDLKLHKKSKIPYSRMGLEKKSYWMEQLMSKTELREKVQRIKQMTDSIQIWEDPNDHIPRIVESTGFYQVAVQLVIDHTHWSRASEQSLDQVLSQVKGIIFRSVKQGRILKAMFACTQTMRCNYYRYGQTLSIDYITGVTRKRQASGKQYQVGFFTGQDHAGNLVIFGVSLISKELSTYHLKSLELFYDIMGKQVFPKLICIPDNKPLIMSLQIFKKRQNIQFEYAINWFYVVQFLKKNSGQQLQKNTIIDLFCKAMSEPIPILYRSIMSKILTQIVNTSNYKQIQKLGEMFCISRLKTNFIGFGLSTERVQQLYCTLERELVYQLKIGSFLNNLFRMDKNLCEDRCRQQSAQLSNSLNIIGIQNKVLEIHSKYIQQIKQSYQNLQPNTKPQKLEQNLEQIPIHELEQLLKVSSLIHINIFNQYLHNFYYSLPHHFTLTTHGKYQTEYIIKQNKSKNKCVYFCKYFLDDNCWKCNCKIISLTGLPCSHLIRVILLTKGSLEYYIHSRWLFPSKQEINNHYTSSSKLQPKIQDRISDHLSVRSQISGLHRDNLTVKQNQSDDNASFVSGSVASHKYGLYEGNQRSIQVKSQNQASKQSLKKSHSSINNALGQQNNQNNNKKSLTFRQLFFQELQKTQKQQNQQANQNDLPLIIQKPQNNSPQKPASQKEREIKSNKNSEAEVIQDENDHYEGEERSEQIIFPHGASINNLDQFQYSSLKMNCQEGNLYQWDLDKKEKPNQFNIFKPKSQNQYHKRKQANIKIQDLIAQRYSQEQNMGYDQSIYSRQQQMQQQHKQQQYYPQLQQQKQIKIMEQQEQEQKPQLYEHIQEEDQDESEIQPHNQ